MRAIAGGGRYNNLVKLISGGKVDLPALGFGMGDVVLGDLLQEKKLVPGLKSEVDAFVLIEDEGLRDLSLGVVQQLREAGMAVEYSMIPAKGDKQFKRAMELASRVTVRCGHKEGVASCIVKELATRKEVEVPASEVVAAVRGSIG